MIRFVAVIFSVLLSVSFLATQTHAHGVIGKRFIPSTLVLEDPFPSDELDILTVNRGPKDKEGRETSFGFEFGKRLTPDLAIGIGWEYIFFNPRQAGERSTSGAGNPEFGVKYSVLKSAEHEGIISVGLNIEAGGAGSRRVAERVTTIAPALYFVNVWGDRPYSLAF